MKTKKNGFFSGVDKRWDKILKQNPPVEHDGNYFFRDSDWGHITPHLQNPRNLTAKGYLKEAINFFNKGDNLLKEGDYVKAYEYVLVSYLLAHVAGHIDYNYSVMVFKKKSGNKISKEQISELLKKNNKKLIHIEEKILIVKNQIGESLKEKNLEKEMQKINEKYNMHFAYGDIDLKKDFKSVKKAPVKKLAIVPKVDKSKDLEQEIKDLKFDNEALNKALSRANEETKKILYSEIDRNNLEIKKLESDLIVLKKAA